MYIKKIVSIMLIFMCGLMASQAQQYEKTRKIIKSFVLPQNAELSISNKYGNIHLLQWEKDSVRFEVDLIFRSSKADRVAKMLKEIDVRFSESSFYVSAVTSFPGSGKLWNEITDVTKSVIQSGNEAEINYTVYIPSHAKLKIENRFGNIYIHDHAAATDIRISNGTFQANTINGKSQITVSFGSAQIHSMKDALVELNYADLQLNEAGKLQLNGRSSTMQLGQVEVLQLNSRRDKIDIESAGSVRGDASFSRLQFEYIGKDLMLSTNYGNLLLTDLDKLATFVQLSSNFTSLKLMLPAGTNASIDVNWNKKSRIVLPNRVRFKHAAMENLSTEEGSIEATLGKEKGINMRFNLTGGELEINEF